MTNAAVAVPAEVIGWRAFALDGGRLVSPFQRDKWPQISSRMHWSGGVNRAECLQRRAGCVAPGQDCTCGYRATEDLDELVALLSDLCFEDDAPSVLEECGVLAKVKLSGTIRAGAFDDPPTTWRGSIGQVLEVRLAPFLEHSAEALESTYSVPVVVYQPDEWPPAVEERDLESTRREVSPDAFHAALLRLRFGEAGLLKNRWKRGGSGRAIIEDLVKVGHDAADNMTSGVSTRDLARALFDSALKPTIPQAEAFVEAVAQHLYPFDPKTVKRTQIFTVPPSPSAQQKRAEHLRLHQERRSTW